MNNILKEVIIILLLAAVIIMMFGILFYDSMQVQTVDKVEYNNEEITEVLGNDEDNKSTLDTKNYTVTKEDLSNYADEKGYENGKKNPFEETSTSTDITTVTTKVNNTVEDTNKNTKVENNINNTEAKSTTVENKSETTTGTFFESKNSK